MLFDPAGAGRTWVLALPAIGLAIVVGFGLRYLLGPLAYRIIDGPGARPGS